MATKQVSSPAPARIDQAEYIAAQIALLRWIESARTELEMLHIKREWGGPLDAQMRSHHLVSGLDWSEHTSTGLNDFMNDIAGRVAVLAETPA